ncbi:MAG: S-adenosylmethionine:tRNA ribosyltransferase-isomerase [Flavobacteriales bacterium]|nr:S-adenosylmethionine:tRNA ribosyltransferase-isomerase [Flavobacteriales bacterium]
MHPRELSIHDFTYDLPDERIARHPLAERDASRTLLYRDGSIEDRHFRELPELLPDSALLVLNDTRVVRARLLFRRATGALLEFMVLDPADGRTMEVALLDKGPSRWWCMVGNAKRWKGEELTCEHEGQVLTARRIDHRDGEHLIEFTWKSDGAFVDVLRHMGTVPLPPYMRREAMPADTTRYNTVFAAHDGSIAAPTASLHFSEDVLKGLERRGIRTTRITLHVGAGTFLPVKSERMEHHAMHSEQVRVPLEALKQLRAQLGTGPIVPVGTTALRTLESVYWHGVMLLQGRAAAHMLIDQWEPYAHTTTELPSTAAALDAVIASVERYGSPLSGTTALMIAPGYTFKLADALVTNFHQPQSTLLLLVAAFVGPDWRRVYDHALAHGYRFLSYGDGSLLFRVR